jgi:hypothetical protein
MYRCSVRAKDPRAVLEERAIDGFVDFKTSPKSAFVHFVDFIFISYIQLAFLTRHKWCNVNLAHRMVHC